MGTVDFAKVALDNNARVLRAVASSKQAWRLLLRGLAERPWIPLLAAGLLAGGIFLSRRAAT